MPDIGENIDQRAALLEKTQWAADFTWKEMRILARYLSQMRVKAGMPVFEEGSRDAYMCIVVEGSVQALKHNVKNEAKVLSVINAGKTFGEMALFDREPRSARIVSAENTILLVMTSDNLQRMMTEAPGLAAKLLFKLGKLLSQKLRMTSGRLVDYME